jgi:hypothetical protein
VRTISSLTADGTAFAGSYYQVSKGWALFAQYTFWPADYVITGTFGFTSTEREHVLAKRAVRLLAARWLANTSVSDNVPTSLGGSMITGFTSGNTSFSLYTPTGDQTGYQDVDALLERIGRRPIRRRGFVHSVPMVGVSRADAETVDVEGDV